MKNFTKTVLALSLMATAAAAYCATPWPTPDTDYIMTVNLQTCTSTYSPESLLIGSVTGGVSSSWNKANGNGWNGAGLNFPNGIFGIAGSALMQAAQIQIADSQYSGNASVAFTVTDLNGNPLGSETIIFGDDGSISPSGSLPAPYQLSYNGSWSGSNYSGNINITFDCSSAGHDAKH
jgi:hypothetical protein